MAMVEINRFDILLISLDPTLGAEIKKTRPCVVVSPNEMNKYISTVIVAPMTSTIKSYPTRIKVSFQDKTGNIILDQLRTIDKSRIVKKIGILEEDTALQVSSTLCKIFAYQ